MNALAFGPSVKFPHTCASRSATQFCKVLTRVLPDAPFGLGFEGRIYRCGANVRVNTLSEDPCVVLECAGPVKPRNPDYVYVLWLLDREKPAFREVGRAVGAVWMTALRPLALRCLGVEDSLAPGVANVGAAAVRVIGNLDDELKLMPAASQAELLSAIDPEISSRIARYLL